jgi:hypothetical protein
MRRVLDGRSVPLNFLGRKVVSLYRIGRCSTVWDSSTSSRPTATISQSPQLLAET